LYQKIIPGEADPNPFAEWPAARVFARLVGLAAFLEFIGVLGVVSFGQGFQTVVGVIGFFGLMVLFQQPYLRCVIIAVITRVAVAVVDATARSYLVS
jgi:hypothetical protein